MLREMTLTYAGFYFPSATEVDINEAQWKTKMVLMGYLKFQVWFALTIKKGGTQFWGKRKFKTEQRKNK